MNREEVKEVVGSDEFKDFVEYAKATAGDFDDYSIGDYGERWFVVQEDGFMYKDEFHGNIARAGKEMVWVNHYGCYVPVWFINYESSIMKTPLSNTKIQALMERGIVPAGLNKDDLSYTLPNGMNAKDIYDFLKEKLTNPDPEFPVRGPLGIQIDLERKLLYRNEAVGNSIDFGGSELIAYINRLEEMDEKFRGGLAPGVRDLNINIFEGIVIGVFFCPYSGGILYSEED